MLHGTVSRWKRGRCDSRLALPSSFEKTSTGQNANVHLTICDGRQTDIVYYSTSCK